MTKFPEFKKALVAWRNAAVRLLGQQGGIRFTQESWTGSDGLPRVSSRPFWDVQKIDLIYQLPEWKQFRDIVEATPKINAYLGIPIVFGNDEIRISLEEIGRKALPVPYSYDGRHVKFDFSNFSRFYGRLEDFISEKQVEVVTVWPLNGLRINRTIRLDEHTVIKRLTVHELAECIAGGLVSSPSPCLPIPPDDANKYCGIFLTQHLPKKLGGQPIGYPEKYEEEKQELIEGLVMAAALVGFKHLRFVGRAESVGWPFSFNSSQWAEQPYTHPNATIVVNPKELRVFMSIWRKFFRNGQPRNKALLLATRRLVFAGQRDRADDQLLDLMIAAEALYLGDSHTELNYKLSLRGAYWADSQKLQASKQQVYQLLKDAYDVRSKLAHGSPVRPGAYKYKGAVVTSSEFNQILENILQLGILKAFQQSLKTAGTFKPDWDQVIIKELG
jgi:hypothetical protein